MKNKLTVRITRNDGKAATIVTTDRAKEMLSLWYPGKRRSETDSMIDAAIKTGGTIKTYNASFEGVAYAN